MTVIFAVVGVYDVWSLCYIFISCYYHLKSSGFLLIIASTHPQPSYIPYAAYVSYVRTKKARRW